MPVILDLGDVVPSVEPVRSHAGVNVAGPPTCESNAGGRHKKVEECGDIRGGGRRVEVEDVRYLQANPNIKEYLSMLILFK